MLKIFDEALKNHLEGLDALMGSFGHDKNQGTFIGTCENCTVVVKSLGISNSASVWNFGHAQSGH